MMFAQDSPQEEFDFRMSLLRLMTVPHRAPAPEETAQLEQISVLVSRDKPID